MTASTAYTYYWDADSDRPMGTLTEQTCDEPAATAAALSRAGYHIDAEYGGTHA